MSRYSKAYGGGVSGIFTVAAVWFLESFGVPVPLELHLAIAVAAGAGIVCAAPANDPPDKGGVVMGSEG